MAFLTDTYSLTSSISSDSNDDTDDDIVPSDNPPFPDGTKYTKRPDYCGADADCEENVDVDSDEEDTEKCVPPYPNPIANGTQYSSPKTQTALNDNNDSKSNTNYNNETQQFNYQLNHSKKSVQV